MLTANRGLPWRADHAEDEEAVERHSVRAAVTIPPSSAMIASE